MARSVGDWVPCQGYGVTEGVDDSTGVLSFALVIPRDQLGLAGEVASVETHNEVVTERVIGYVDIEVPEAADDEIRVIERIRVGLYDDAGLAAFYADSLADAPQANEPFLWQRVSRYDAGQNNNNVVCHPWWSYLDVKSARKLERQQFLAYSVQTFGAATERVNVTPFLRTWARLVNRK